jgi:hypothetical protein
MTFVEVIDFVARCLEGAGVAVIVIGALGCDGAGNSPADPA